MYCCIVVILNRTVSRGWKRLIDSLPKSCLYTPCEATVEASLDEYFVRGSLPLFSPWLNKLLHVKQLRQLVAKDVRSTQFISNDTEEILLMKICPLHWNDPTARESDLILPAAAVDHHAWAHKNLMFLKCCTRKSHWILCDLSTRTSVALLTTTMENWTESLLPLAAQHAMLFPRPNIKQHLLSLYMIPLPRELTNGTRIIILNDLPSYCIASIPLFYPTSVPTTFLINNTLQNNSHYYFSCKQGVFLASNALTANTLLYPVVADAPQKFAVAADGHQPPFVALAGEVHCCDENWLVLRENYDPHYSHPVDDSCAYFLMHFFHLRRRVVTSPPYKQFLPRVASAVGATIFEYLLLTPSSGAVEIVNMHRGICLHRIRFTLELHREVPDQEAAFYSSLRVVVAGENRLIVLHPESRRGLVLKLTNSVL